MPFISRRPLFRLFPAALLLAGSARVMAQIPRTISFQGVMADPTGKPKVNATYSVTFRLYDALTGGNLLWTEANKPVVVTGGQGLFSIVLGSPTSFGSLAFNKPYFLEAQGSGDPPMTPRLPLSSVPYSLRAEGAGLTLPFSGSANVAGPGAAFSATNSGTGAGLSGTSSGGYGIFGQTGSYQAAVYGSHTGTEVSAAGVEGHSESFHGVLGYSAASDFAGVAGISSSTSPGNGVYGASYNGGAGVVGSTNIGIGVYGETDSGSAGVSGKNAGTTAFAYGVKGFSAGGVGVYGNSTSGSGSGVTGEGPFGVTGIATANGTGVTGTGANGVKGTGVNTGVWADSDSGWALYAATATGQAVHAYTNSGGTLFLGESFNGISTRNVFRVDADGKVFANGNFQASGADVAEFIATSDQPQPGDVVEIDPDREGHFRRSRTANSTRVAGVISTLPGVSVGADRPAEGTASGPQLALVGRVPVRVTNEGGLIRVGDLLTSSGTPGCGMRAPRHPEPGTIIGKALSALAAGEGTVEMLVMLR